MITCAFVIYFFTLKKNIYLTEQLRKNYDSAESDRKLLITEMQRLRTQYEDLIKQLEQTQVIVDQQKVSSEPTQYCIYLHRATLFKVLPLYLIFLSLYVVLTLNLNGSSFDHFPYTCIYLCEYYVHVLFINQIWIW